MQGGSISRDQNKKGLKSNHIGDLKDFSDQLCSDLERLTKDLTFLDHAFNATRQCWVAILVLSKSISKKRKNCLYIVGAGCSCEISSE